MKCLKMLAGTSLAAILALTTATVWAQTTPQNATLTVSSNQSVDEIDQDVAQKISQAWSEGKDASGAVAFQENAEIAMSEGNQQQARHYLVAAEHELAQLRPVHTSAQASESMSY
ncbi:MAG: hypothetical protein ACLQU2_34655 [Candidatus Binataceae bacterium]